MRVALAEIISTTPNDFCCGFMLSTLPLAFFSTRKEGQSITRVFKFLSCRELSLIAGFMHTI